MFKGLKNKILKWKNRLLENRKKELIMKRNLLKEIENIIMSKKNGWKSKRKIIGKFIEIEETIPPMVTFDLSITTGSSSSLCKKSQ